jgi:hypothetical protein
MFHTYDRDKFQKVSSQSFTTLFCLLTCNYTSETARLILASDWPTNTKRVGNNHTYPGSYMKLKVCSMIGRIWSEWKSENCWRPLSIERITVTYLRVWHTFDIIMSSINNWVYHWSGWYHISFKAEAKPTTWTNEPLEHCKWHFCDCLINAYFGICKTNIRFANEELCINKLLPSK